MTDAAFVPLVTGLFPDDEPAYRVSDALDILASVRFPEKAPYDEGFDDGLAWALAREDYAKALDQAVTSGVIAVLDPLSFVALSSPVGSALLPRDELQRFARMVRIELVQCCILFGT